MRHANFIKVIPSYEMLHFDKGSGTVALEPKTPERFSSSNGMQEIFPAVSNLSPK